MGKHKNYSFITVYKSGKILTQAKLLGSEHKKIKANQRSLAEAAWGADVAHKAQSLAETKLNFQSVEDAVEALVEEVGCSREEAQCRIANVKTTMQTKLQKALIRTPSQELAQQGNGCRSMAPHVAQRGSSTTSKGLFGQVVQQQQATGRRVHQDDGDEDACPAAAPSLGCVPQPCNNHGNSAAALVPAKRPHHSAAGSPAKPGAGSTQCPSRLTAAEGTPPACDSKRHKGANTAHGRGAAGGSGCPYYGDFDDLAPEPVSAAACAPRATVATGPAPQPAVVSQDPSQQQEQHEQQQQAVKQEAETEQQLGGMAEVHLDQQAAQQEHMLVKEEPQQQEHHHHQQGLQQGFQPMASNELQQQSGAQHHSGSGAMPTEGQQIPAAHDPMLQSALHGNPLQLATHEAPSNPAQQGTSQQPAPGSNPQRQSLKDLLDRRMCQGLSNWPPAEVFSSEAMPDSIALQGSVAVTPQLLALLLTPKPLVIKLLKLCKFWARQRHLSLQTCNIRERPALMSNSPTTTPRHKGCSCIQDVHVLTGALVLIDMGPGQAPRLRRVAETISVGGCLCCRSTCSPTAVRGQVVLRLETGTVVPIDKLAEADVSTLPPRHVQYMLCEYAYQLEVEKHVQPITRADVLATVTRLQRAARCLPLLAAALTMRAASLAGGAEVVGGAGMCPFYPQMRAAVQQPADEVWSRVIASLDDLGSDAHAKAVLTGLRLARQRPQHAAGGTSRHPFARGSSESGTVQASQRTAAQPHHHTQSQPRPAVIARIEVPVAQGVAGSSRVPADQGSVPPVRVGQKREAEEVYLPQHAAAAAGAGGQHLPAAALGGDTSGKRSRTDVGLPAPAPGSQPQAQLSVQVHAASAGRQHRVVTTELLPPLAGALTGQQHLHSAEGGQGEQSQLEAALNSGGNSTPDPDQAPTAIQSDSHVNGFPAPSTSQQQQQFRAGLKALLIPQGSGSAPALPTQLQPPTINSAGVHDGQPARFVDSRLPAGEQQRTGPLQQVNAAVQHTAVPSQQHAATAAAPAVLLAQPVQRLPTPALNADQVPHIAASQQAAAPGANAAAGAAEDPNTGSAQQPHAPPVLHPAGRAVAVGTSGAAGAANAGAAALQGMTSMAAHPLAPSCAEAHPPTQADPVQATPQAGDSTARPAAAAPVPPHQTSQAAPHSHQVPAMPGAADQPAVVTRLQGGAGGVPQPRAAGSTTPPASAAPPVASVHTGQAAPQSQQAPGNAAGVDAGGSMAGGLTAPASAGEVKGMTQPGDAADAQGSSLRVLLPQPAGDGRPGLAFHGDAVNQGLGQPGVSPIAWFRSITSHPKLSHLSFEELRWEAVQQAQANTAKQQQAPVNGAGDAGANAQPRGCQWPLQARTVTRPALVQEWAIQHAAEAFFDSIVTQGLRVEEAVQLAHLKQDHLKVVVQQAKAFQSQAQSLQLQSQAQSVQAPPQPAQQLVAAPEPTSPASPAATARLLICPPAPHKHASPEPTSPNSPAAGKSQPLVCPPAPHKPGLDAPLSPSPLKSSGVQPAQPQIVPAMQPVMPINPNLLPPPYLPIVGPSHVKVPVTAVTAAAQQLTVPALQQQQIPQQQLQTQGQGQSLIFGGFTGVPSTWPAPSATASTLAPAAAPTYTPARVGDASATPGGGGGPTPAGASQTSPASGYAPTSPAFVVPSPVYNPVSPGYSPAYMPSEPAYRHASPANPQGPASQGLTASRQEPAASGSANHAPQMPSHSLTAATYGTLQPAYQPLVLPPAPSAQPNWPSTAGGAAPGAATFSSSSGSGLVPAAPFHAATTTSLQGPFTAGVPRTRQHNNASQHVSSRNAMAVPTSIPATGTSASGSADCWAKQYAAEIERVKQLTAGAGAGPSGLPVPGQQQQQPQQQQQQQAPQQQQLVLHHASAAGLPPDAALQEEDYVGGEGTPEQRAKMQGLALMSRQRVCQLWVDPSLKKLPQEEEEEGWSSFAGVHTRDACAIATMVFSSGTPEHQLLLFTFLALLLVPRTTWREVGGVYVDERLSFSTLGTLLQQFKSPAHKQFKNNGGSLWQLLQPWSIGGGANGIFPVFKLERGRSGNCIIQLSSSGFAALRKAWVGALALVDDGADGAGNHVSNQQGDTQSQPNNSQQERKVVLRRSPGMRLLLLHMLAPYVNAAGNNATERCIRRNEARLARHLLCQPSYSCPAQDIVPACKLDAAALTQPMSLFIERSGLFVLKCDWVKLAWVETAWRVLAEKAARAEG